MCPPPRVPGSGIRAIELFSASGGLAKGFREAGIEFLMAFDFSSDACASYEANLGQRPVQLDVRDLLRMIRMGWSPGRLDLIAADPPCAPWSRAGRRQGLEDDRDMLAETVEVIRLLRPRAFLLGNIPGLQDSTTWPVVQKFIGGLARDGYCVRDYACIDAADLGVPQRRLRPFWYGHLDGPCLVWPEATHADPKKLSSNVLLPGHAPLLPWVTCRRALGHLPLEQLGRPVMLRENPRHKATAPDRPAKTVTAKVRGNGGQAVEIIAHPRHPASELDEPAHAVLAGDGGGSRRTLRVQPLMGARVGDPDQPAATLPAKAARVGAGAALVLEIPGARPKRGQPPKGPQSGRLGDPDAPAHVIDTRVPRAGSGDSGALSWPWDKPSTTIFAETDRIAPPCRSGSHGQPQGANAIVLSELSAKILQGFPEDWIFVGASKKARWSQLGQAVPIIVAAALGRSVVRQLGGR